MAAISRWRRKSALARGRTCSSRLSGVGGRVEAGRRSDDRPRHRGPRAVAGRQWQATDTETLLRQQDCRLQELISQTPLWKHYKRRDWDTLLAMFEPAGFVTLSQFKGMTASLWPNEVLFCWFCFVCDQILAATRT